MVESIIDTWCAYLYIFQFCFFRSLACPSARRCHFFLKTGTQNDIGISIHIWRSMTSSKSGMQVKASPSLTMHVHHPHYGSTAGAAVLGFLFCSARRCMTQKCIKSRMCAVIIRSLRRIYLSTTQISSQTWRSTRLSRSVSATQTRSFVVSLGESTWSPTSVRWMVSST